MFYDNFDILILLNLKINKIIFYKSFSFHPFILKMTQQNISISPKKETLFFLLHNIIKFHFTVFFKKKPFPF